MSKHYLITGGAGLIGGKTAAALLAKGNKIRILDNFTIGKRNNYPKSAEIVESDIRDLKSIASSFRDIDFVLHTAALCNIQQSIENPIETNEVNVTGTLNVIEAARRAGVKRIVFCSSAAVYGEQNVILCEEHMHPNPISPYGLQKYVGEYYMKMAQRLWNLETVVLRYFNVYGPDMKTEGTYSTVIGIFLKQMASGKPLTITADGTQTRDFVYIDDVVEANLTALESSHVGNGEIINIASGMNNSVNEIAKFFGGKTVHIPPREEIHDVKASIVLAKKFLGWRPKMNLEEGIRQTIEWFNSTLRHD